MTVFDKRRVVAWFSCGAASAAAARVALEKYGDRAVVVYCDTMASEHPDNARFMADVERWLGVNVLRINDGWTNVEEVFAKRRYMSGPKGAPCTVAMKKVPRFKFQNADDIHIFGMTADEGGRIARFESNNPDMTLEWVLRDRRMTKEDCFTLLRGAGIKLPAMYALGYKNNNCLGCVKASSIKYWAKVRDDFPDVFAERARQSREFGCRLTRLNGKRIFLDEIPAAVSGGDDMENISCGPECGGEQMPLFVEET